MEKGYNSDVSVKGVSYHVQTEDWGPDNPFLVSSIFRNGAIVKSFKTPYQSIFANGPRSDREAIQFALKEQHYKILDQLISGQL